MAGAAAPDASAGAARALARQILAERRFAAPRVPHPLHGILHAIGQAFMPVTRQADRAVDDLAGALPGGRLVAWAALAAFVILVAALLASVGARRRLRAMSRVAAGDAPARLPDAAELEAAAVRAEQAGRLDDAVRLRFRAGLARLAERELIVAATATTSGQVARALRSERFDALARRFDEIAYGGRPAGADDIEASRREWPLIVAAGARR